MAVQNQMWSQWAGVHNHPDQLTRAKSANLKENTPLSIDSAAQSGTFVGSNGESYHTELDNCTCADFSIRGASYPCKHMYRLAMELGLMPSSSIVSDASIPIMRQQKSKIDALIENGPFNEAYAVYAFTRSVLTRAVPKAKTKPHPLLQNCYLFDQSSKDTYKKNPLYKRDYERIRDLMIIRIGTAVLNGAEENSIVSMVIDLES